MYYHLRNLPFVFCSPSVAFIYQETAIDSSWIHRVEGEYLLSVYGIAYSDVSIYIFARRYRLK